METPSISLPTILELAMPSQAESAYRILVINGKGRAGKTTISTNLAAWLAYRDQATALLDINSNSQPSASAWVAQRSANSPDIYGFKGGGQAQLHAPALQWLISDARQGLSDQDLQQLVLKHHLVIVPALASDSDTRSLTRFIGKLLLIPGMRRQRRPIAVIANRMQQQSESWERLKKFLSSLNIAYPAVLHDSQNYLRAYREGQGVVDYHQQAYLRDRADWEALVQWVDTQYSDYLRSKGEANSEKMPPVPA